MNSEFWIKKWENAETRFHQTQYHPLLMKCVDRLSLGVILVPLCGKSLDMLSLVSKGHSVIGVELSPIACEGFFKEAKIEYSIVPVENFVVFKSDKITIWCGDFFKLPQVVWDSISGIYDRAALIALPKNTREIYAAEIIKRSGKQLEILLITLEYQKDFLQGPPFSVDENELNEIYSSLCIQKLFWEKEEKFKSVEVIESIYWLHK